MSTQQTVEVHLEELGEHSWLLSLANTVSGSYASAQYRCVARTPGPQHRASSHVVTGAIFPVMRFQDLDDLHLPNAWIETARERLEELDEELSSHGWRRGTVTGQHWWSRTYVATCGFRRRRVSPHPPGGRRRTVQRFSAVTTR